MEAAYYAPSAFTRDTNSQSKQSIETFGAFNGETMSATKRTLKRIIRFLKSPDIPFREKEFAVYTLVYLALPRLHMMAKTPLEVACQQAGTMQRAITRAGRCWRQGDPDAGRDIDMIILTTNTIVRGYWFA